MRCLSVLDLVILFYLFFFSLAAKLKGPRMGRQFFKTSIFLLPSPLRGCMSLLEIVFCRTV